MMIFGYDVHVARHYIKTTRPRPLFRVEQGVTPDDWEACVGPWYVVVSRIRGRRARPAKS